MEGGGHGCSAMPRSGQRSRKNSLQKERETERRHDWDVLGGGGEYKEEGWVGCAELIAQSTALTEHSFRTAAYQCLED